MGFRYFLAQNQIEDYEDICVLTLNEEGKECYHIIARVLNISQYDFDLIKEFEDKYIKFFKKEIYQIDEEHFSFPKAVAWDLKNCLDKNGRIVDNFEGVLVRDIRFKE